MARDPNQTYSHGGKLYGPGQPNSVAELDKIKPLKARKGAEEGETVNETPLATGSVSKTGAVHPHESSASTSDSVLTEEELEGMKMPELKALAAERGVEVKGGKKADYVKALAG